LFSVSPIERSVPVFHSIAFESEQHLSAFDVSSLSLHSLACDLAMTAPDSASSPVSSASPAIGVDVSKASLEVALIGTEETSASHTAVPNTEEGFEELVDWIGRQTVASNVHVCLEASGGYEKPVARHLYEQDLTVSVINPQRTSAYAKSQLTRSKTDQVDARILARFCQREEPSSWQPASSEQRNLKEMTRGLQGLKKERDRLNNQIDQSSNPTVTGSLESVLESVNEQIDRLEEAIDNHVQSADALARSQELLETIPGVGQTTAALVLAELGDPERFESARQAAAYAGLTPSHHESGSSVHRKPRLSKVGSSRLRKALYFPAISALRCNTAIEALGSRLAERGKAKMVIVGAAMRKLLHICYGVLKNQSPFDPSLHPGT